jgi:hypothetical protein
VIMMIRFGTICDLDGLALREMKRGWGVMGQEACWRESSTLTV